MRGKVESLTIDVEGRQRITFALTQDGRSEYEAIKDIDDLVIECKKYRKKRSLDANAYLWVLLGKLADALRTSKDEIYLMMLERYGVYTHLIVKPKVVERVKAEWRTVRELGEVTVNGQTGVQLQCYFGSSTYDTKEMSVLLDGVISEAKALGIETMTPDEILDMKSRWAV